MNRSCLRVLFSVAASSSPWPGSIESASSSAPSASPSPSSMAAPLLASAHHRAALRFSDPLRTGESTASSFPCSVAGPGGGAAHLTAAESGAGQRAGMSRGGFRNGVVVSDARLKGQLSFSSRQGSVMSQISEVGSEELDDGRSSPEPAGSNASGAPHGYSGIPRYPMGGAWTDEPSLSPMSGAKRPRDSGPVP